LTLVFELKGLKGMILYIKYNKKVNFGKPKLIYLAVNGYTIFFGTYVTGRRKPCPYERWELEKY